MVQYIHVPFLSTLAACVVHGGCIAVAVWLMPALSINMALALIIINTYDDLISLFLLKERQREEREGGRERSAQGKKICLSPIVCILCMSVTSSTDTDIETLAKCCSDVDMTI